MLRYNNLDRISRSIATPEEVAIKNIDMLNLKDIDKVLPCFYPDQIAYDTNLLMNAVEVLSNALELDTWASDEREVMNDFLSTAYNLLDKYNHAYIELRR